MTRISVAGACLGSILSPDSVLVLPGPTWSNVFLRKALACVPAVPQRADHKVVDTIDQLVTRVIGGCLSPKERALLKEDPAYW